MTISGRDAKALRRARRLQIELRELQKDLDEQRDVALRSPPLDGMPGRCADADRMTVRLIRIEQMERKVRDMERHAEAAQWEAKRICWRMKDRKARISLRRITRRRSRWRRRSEPQASRREQRFSMCAWQGTRCPEEMTKNVL